jgi:hypothetical protein
MVLLTENVRKIMKDILDAESVPTDISPTDSIGTYSIKDIIGPDDEEGPDDEGVPEELDNMIADKNSIYYTIVYAKFTLYSYSYSLFLFYYDEKNNQYTLPYASVKKGENIATIVNRYTKDFIPTLTTATRKIDNYILYDISDMLISPYMKEKDDYWKWLSPFEIVNYQQYKRTNISKDNIDFFMKHQTLWNSEDIPIILFKEEKDKIKYYNNSKISGIEQLERCIYFYDDVKLKDADESIDVYDIDSNLVMNNENVEILNNTYLLCLESIYNGDNI